MTFQTMPLTSARLAGGGAIGGVSPLDRLFEGQRIHRLRSGAALFVEGDERRVLYRIREGFALRTRHLADGARQVVGFGEPGDVIGFRHWDGRHAETALAARDLVYQRVSFDALSTAMRAFPEIALDLMNNLQMQTGRLEDLFLLRSRQNSHRLLAGFLIRLYERLGVDAGSVLHLPLSRTDIADYLGFSAETASRAFTRLREMGLATPTGRRDIRILDAAGLARLANRALAEAGGASSERTAGRAPGFGAA